MPQQSYPPRIGLPLMVIIPTTALVLGGIGYYRIQINQEILPPIHIFFSELGIIAALILVPLLGLLLWANRRLEIQTNQATQAEAKYHSIFENAQEGIFQTTEDGRYLSANPALARIYGYDSPQKLMEELTNIDRQLYIDPEWRNEFHRLMQDCGNVVGFEPQIFRKDGTIRWISENSHAVRDSSGALLYYEGRVEDISERKQAEEERDRFFRLSPDMQCVVTMDGIFQQTNAAFEWTFGLTQEQLLSHPLLTFLHPDDRNHTESALQELSTGKDVTSFENRFRSSDGAYRWLHWRAAAFVNEDRIYAVARDITERKKEGEELQHWEAHVRQTQKLEAIGSLAGGIVHDFNNILTVIIGFTQLSLMNSFDEKTVRQQLDEVLLAGHRAKGFIKQLLAFSQPTGNERRPVCLKMIIEETLTLLHATIPASIEIHQDIQTRNTKILADASQIHQVLMNLCMNASHAMNGNSGTIAIRLDEVDITPQFAALSPKSRMGCHPS